MYFIVLNNMFADAMQANNFHGCATFGLSFYIRIM